MFKRLFWLCMGAGFGFGASLWMQRALQGMTGRLTLGRLLSALVAAARALVASLAEAS